VEASGDLVVTDAGLSAVVRVDPVTGDRTIVSDAGTGAGPALNYPPGIAVEASGDLVVIESSLNAVLRVDPVTGDRTIVSDAGTGAGPAFLSPVGIAVVATGDLVVTDPTLNVVLRVDPITGDRTVFDCEPPCGNGSMDPGEECDGGAGCTDCVCNSGFEPTSPPSLDCQPIALEACCLPDGNCVTIPEVDCLAQGGVPQGPGTTCTTTEACCFPNDTCAMVDPLCCDDLGGTVVAGTCGGMQACCVDTGACYMADEACCLANGDTPKGAGSVCLGDSNSDGADDACVPPVPEACCLPDGSCLMILEVDCMAQGGIPQGPGTTCTIAEACCFPDDTCAMVDPLCCDDLGGTVVAGACGGMQACCVDTGACYLADEACCLANGHTPKGSGSVCLGDVDADGTDDACEPAIEGIPTVSAWGLGILALTLLVGARVYFNRRRAAHA